MISLEVIGVLDFFLRKLTDVRFFSVLSLHVPCCDSLPVFVRFPACFLYNLCHLVNWTLVYFVHVFLSLSC